MGRKARIAMNDEEKELCKLMMQMETELVARKLGIKPNTIYQRFYRLRNRIQEAEKLLNQVKFYSRNSRLRKLLTKPKLEGE